MIESNIMGLFDKIFNRHKNRNNKVEIETNSKQEKEEFVSTPELDELEKVYDKLSSLVEKDEFIPRSAYVSIRKPVSELELYYTSLLNDNALESYCSNKNFDYQKIKKILNLYNDYENIVISHNKECVNKLMIENKDYLDNIFKDVDPNIYLDDNQRDVVLSDEDYTLVVAGAGAGKTTTVAAKVKYLVDKKGIDPKDILVISFTNKAVEELKERINNSLNIPCPITTFHKAGYAILRKEDNERYEIAGEDTLFFVLRDFFTEEVLKDESLVKTITMFFSYYLKDPKTSYDSDFILKDITKMDFFTMRSELKQFEDRVIDTRSQKKITLKCEKVRSLEELQIANFLYLHNIDYIYEPRYKYNIYNANKPYTPDFLLKQGDKQVYLEHFGISENGKSSRYDEATLEFYKYAMNEKIALHKAHDTKLMYTFSSYNDGRSLLIHLEDELRKNGFILSTRDEQEVLHNIIKQEQSYYMSSFIDLMTRFIHSFKTNNYGFEKFDEWITSTNNERDKAFLKLAKISYRRYQNYLEGNKMIDFEDMINKSAKLLDDGIQKGSSLSFKYIIVDEYQDISRQRYDLVSSLSKLTKAKIIAVGDDFQSIYAFSGSDISLFTNFAEKFGYSDLKTINKTYRNAQEIIDIAGGFIQENKSQIQKQLISNKHIDIPMIIQIYDDSRKIQKKGNTGSRTNLAEETVRALDHIVEFAKKDGKDPYKQKILLLGRFNFDVSNLAKTGLFQIKDNKTIRCNKYPKLQIEFMTAHSSKGLGYDNVILINCRNSRFGFPSKIEDDVLLKYVLSDDNSYEYAEERRLFYVAMTRTKNRVYFITPQSCPSEFLIELKNNYKNIVLEGNWDDKEGRCKSRTYNCPVCGYPLQARFKASIGLPLYVCSNDPEVCGFITNDLHGDKMSIEKCPDCDDGYLVVKRNYKDNNYFLGCSNYKDNGKGCNCAVSKISYYREKGYKLSGLKDDSYLDERGFSYTPSLKSCIDAKHKNNNKTSKTNEEVVKDDKTPKTINSNNIDNKKPIKDNTSSIISKDNQVSSLKDKKIPKPIKGPCFRRLCNLEQKMDDSLSDEYKKLFTQVYCVMNGINKLQWIINASKNDVYFFLRGDITKKIDGTTITRFKEFGSLKDLSKEELIVLINFCEKQVWYIEYSDGLQKYVKITLEGKTFYKYLDKKKLEELSSELSSIKR